MNLLQKVKSVGKWLAGGAAAFGLAACVNTPDGGSRDIDDQYPAFANSIKTGSRAVQTMCLGTSGVAYFRAQPVSAESSPFCDPFELKEPAYREETITDTEGNEKKILVEIPKSETYQSVIENLQPVYVNFNAMACEGRDYSGFVPGIMKQLGADQILDTVDGLANTVRQNTERFTTSTKAADCAIGFQQAQEWQIWNAERLKEKGLTPRPEETTLIGGGFERAYTTSQNAGFSFSNVANPLRPADNGCRNRSGVASFLAWVGAPICKND